MNKRGVVTIVAVFVGLFAVFFGLSAAMVGSFGKERFGLDDAPRIGVVEITGAIMDSKKAVKDLRRFVKDETIKAIVVRVDSPGGAVAPSQEIYEAVRKAKGAKPLVVSMGTVAASGGYYIAVASDTIFANPGTLTGSIGVISQFYSLHKLVERAEVEVHTFRSGPNKAAGSPLEPLTQSQRDVFELMISDVYAQFVEDVAKGRKLEVKVVEPLADGRIYTGRQAKRLQLVDKLGTMQDAVDFVANKASLSGEPKLVYPPKPNKTLLEMIVGGGGLQGALRSTMVEQSTPMVEYRWTGP